MQPYDKIQKSCKYGEYDETRKSAYTITNRDELSEPWYYIYQNRKILLYVDQNGPVKIQYQPPSGILVVKRELGEKQSKLLTWIQSNDVNDGVPFNNFNSPNLQLGLVKPEYTVNWDPTKATYVLSYPELDVVTEIFVPFDKATICVKTTIKNKLDKEQNITVTPSVFPYINKPQMVAWDLPEWYLSANVKKNGNALTFCGKMKSPEMIKENERSVTYNVDFDVDAGFEMNMSKYTRSGTFFSPNTVTEDTPLSNVMGDYATAEGFSSFTAVFASKYKTTLKAGESKTFTQVLTVQEAVDYNQEENDFEKIYFEKQGYEKRVAETDAFYEELFSKRTVKTENPLYDNFINNFAPLQMYWVGSLDRGWPSSMRGTRDASQDFTGIVPLYPEWARKVIIELFEHQRTDGWMPRQVSTISRQAPHDMRYFSDGGAFLLELIHEYLTFTRDYSILEEKVWWLDSDEESTVLEHIFRTTEYYLDPLNIGEHGLVKVWHGDWWDVMDKIGLDGRGETVTVTAQMVLNLKNLAKMLDWMIDIDKTNQKYSSLKERYLKAREKFIEAMQKHAYNKLGFFNGYFNDNGKWLLSDNDPDGRERLYLVSNSWAIIGECCTDEMQKSVIDNVEKRNSCRRGHATSSTPFYDYIDKAGRAGLGGAKNVGVYNHAQSFYIRACCKAGRADLAYNASRYILPFEQEYAPVEFTYAAPFVIANGYNNSDQFLHRVQLQYLSGTVSYVLRTVHNFFFGVEYGYKGLNIAPCLPKEFGNCATDFTYLGKKFRIEFIKSQTKKITVNDNVVGTESVFIPDECMKDVNLVVIQY
jgi:cellobiose phosphorylase